MSEDRHEEILYFKDQNKNGRGHQLLLFYEKNV